MPSDFLISSAQLLVYNRFYPIVNLHKTDVQKMLRGVDKGQILDIAKIGKLRLDNIRVSVDFEFIRRFGYDKDKLYKRYIFECSYADDEDIISNRFDEDEDDDWNWNTNFSFNFPPMFD